MIAGGDIREIQGKYCSALSGAERLDCKKLVKENIGAAENVVKEMSSSTPSEIGKALLEVLKGTASGGADVTLGQGAPAPVPAPAPGAGTTPPAPPAGGGNAGLPPDVYGSILNQIRANPSVVILNPSAALNLENLRSACEKAQGEENKGKCKATLMGALGQLYLQTNGDLKAIVEALNNYNAARTFVNLQNGKGEVVPVNNFAELENLLKTGFGGSGGGSAKGLQFGFSVTGGTGYYPFNYDYARQDITTDGRGGIPPSTVGRDSIDDGETEVEVESLRQALTSETGAGERTEYKWIVPGVRVSFEVLGPEASGFRYAGKVSFEYDRFPGYSTQRLLNTAEHGNLHEIFVGVYPLGLEFGGSAGSIHLLGGIGPVWGILSGTAQAGPEAGLAEHPRAVGVRPAFELGYATPGDVSLVINLNGGRSIYIDDSNKVEDAAKVIVPVKGLSPEDHFTWMGSIGIRVMFGK